MQAMRKGRRAWACSADCPITGLLSSQTVNCTHVHTTPASSGLWRGQNSFEQLQRALWKLEFVVSFVVGFSPETHWRSC
jgi:hypothetical protein